MTVADWVSATKRSKIIIDSSVKHNRFPTNPTNKDVKNEKVVQVLKKKENVWW